MGIIREIVIAVSRNKSRCFNRLSFSFLNILDKPKARVPILPIRKAKKENKYIKSKIGNLNTEN